MASSILIILTVKKLRPYLQKLDIFKELHNHRVDEPMYLRRTIGGGSFTVFFLILVTTLISLNFIDMLYNETENKALVPLVSI
mmetsp:Transcript_29922/g.5404  ORF Transcript_29922/g.5404 Transcript_29922/m.5404 type:complete len:83 (+) Transcript_29922:114-362(+)